MKSVIKLLNAKRISLKGWGGGIKKYVLKLILLCLLVSFFPLVLVACANSKTGGSAGTYHLATWSAYYDYHSSVDHDDGDCDCYMFGEYNSGTFSYVSAGGRPGDVIAELTNEEETQWRTYYRGCNPGAFTGDFQETVRNTVYTEAFFGIATEPNGWSSPVGVVKLKKDDIEYEYLGNGEYDITSYGETARATAMAYYCDYCIENDYAYCINHPGTNVDSQCGIILLDKRTNSWSKAESDSAVVSALSRDWIDVYRWYGGGHAMQHVYDWHGEFYEFDATQSGNISQSAIDMMTSGQTEIYTYPMEGEFISLPEAEPIRPGYKFIGWYTSPYSQSKGEHIHGTRKYTWTTNMTFYARYEPESFTVTLGYYEDDSDTLSGDEFEYGIDYEFTAEDEEYIYELFEECDEINNTFGRYVAGVYVNYNGNISDDYISLEGWSCRSIIDEFWGEFAEDDLGGVFECRELTFSPYYEEYQYEFTFDSEIDEDGDEESDFYENFWLKTSDTLQAPTTKPTKTGHTFKSWKCTMTTASGVQKTFVLQAGETLLVRSMLSELSSDSDEIYFYFTPQWEINTYSLRVIYATYYDAPVDATDIYVTSTGGTFGGEQTLSRGETVTLSATYSTTPITVNWVVTNKTNTYYMQYYLGKVYGTYSITGSLACTWTPTESTYIDIGLIEEFYFDANGGTGIASARAKSDWMYDRTWTSAKMREHQGSGLTFKATLKKGYVFDGWYDESGTRLSTDMEYVWGTRSNPGGGGLREDLTLTAKATKVYDMIEYNEVDQYFYFEDGLYPQSYIYWDLTNTLTSLYSAGTITAEYYLTIAGQNCPVCMYDGDYYARVWNDSEKHIEVAEGGGVLNFGRSYFWFKLEPIVWRVSPRGVSVDYYSDVLYDRFEADGIYGVSDKVLDWTYVDKVDFQNGDIQTGWSYTDSDLYAATSSNYTNLSSTFVSAAVGSYMFDKIPSVGTNTKIASSSKSVAGLVQASVRDIDSLFQTNYDEIIAASGYNVENPNFDKSARKAYASDLVCVLAGVNYNQYCGYGTRDLYDTQNGFRISAGGSKGNLWLDGDQGIRYVYAYNSESTLVSGLDFNGKIKQYFDATVNCTAQDENVSSITFDFYDAGGGYFVDGQDVTTNDSVDVSTNADGSIKAYFVENGDGLTDVYVLSNQIIKANVASYSMFSYFSKVTGILFRNFDTSNVTTMRSMFSGCSTLTSLDLSNFDTSNVTNMEDMFFGCSALTSLDLSNFDTSNVTGMYLMFDGCSTLTSLDLSNFDTSKVTNMEFMFYGCSNLTTIYVRSNWSTTNVTSSSAMFQGCTNLVGGNGTAYNSSYTDKTYACVDTSSTPGYLTLKS